MTRGIESNFCDILLTFVDLIILLKTLTHIDLVPYLGKHSVGSRILVSLEKLNMTLKFFIIKCQQYISEKLEVIGNKIKIILNQTPCKLTTVIILGISFKH